MDNLDYMNMGRRKLTGKAIVIFISVMLLLTFFSNTINNFTLSKVTYETPSSGSLIKEITGTGKVEAKNVYDMYVRSSMRVTDIYVKVGDTVNRGQIILTLDTTDLENQLKDEQSKYAQKKLQMEKLKETGEKLKAAGDKLKEANTPAALLNLDKVIQIAQQSLEKLQKTYDSSVQLLEAKAITAIEMANAKANLDNAKIDYEIAKNNKDKTIRDNNRDIENNYRDIESNRIDVESTKLDMEAAERKIAGLLKDLEMNKVEAPCNGTVIELHFLKGMMANTSQPLYKIADTAGGMQFTATVSINAAEYLAQGDTAEITINSLNNKGIQGKVSQIKDNQQKIGEKKDVIVDISSAGLIGGEIGSVYIKKNMGSFKTLVSNTAVGHDNDGYFVYVVKERKGPIGNEFYVQRVTVNTGDSDNLKTAILSGISAADKVVSESDKSLSDGSRIMLAQ